VEKREQLQKTCIVVWERSKELRRNGKTLWHDGGKFDAGHIKRGTTRFHLAHFRCLGLWEREKSEKITRRGAPKIRKNNLKKGKEWGFIVVKRRHFEEKIPGMRWTRK